MPDPVRAPDHCCVCGDPIEQPVAQGRPRRHCSAACRARRQRATRARVKAVVASVVGGPDLEERMRAALGRLPEEAFDLPADPDQAALLVLAEAWVLVERLERVAATGRPELAARCAGAAAALAASLI